MRPKIVAGNWKMNKTRSEATQLITEIIDGLKDTHGGKTKAIIAAPFPFLSDAFSLTEKISSIGVAAQNCSSLESGAYTGEVSAAMIASTGVKYVIIGHSERRMYFNETATELAQKIKAALKNNLIPIFCIGENLEQRNSNKQNEVVISQVQDVLSSFSKEDISKCIIAYEPVSAIGTGVTATSAQAQEMHLLIRNCLEKVTDSKTSNSLQILYGGSCNAENAKELFSCPDVDGGLIGGASLKADSFLSIINTANSLQ